MVSFDFARSIWRRHNDGWSNHNTLLIHGFVNHRQNWRHRKKFEHLPITDKVRRNASSLVATVKLYQAFAIMFAGVSKKPLERQTSVKNLSPLLRFYANETL